MRTQLAGLIFGFFVSFYGLSGGATSFAAGGKEKPPTASSVLTQSYKALLKSKGYRVSLAVVGGVSERKDHRVSKQTVRQKDRAEGVTSSKPIMRVDFPKAYRTPSGGAINHGGGIWRHIMSDRKGRRLDRLFAFPEMVMQQALKYRKNSEWVAMKSKKKPNKKRSSKKRGKTAVAKPDEGLPGYIRVTMPPKEARKHFLEVERSGCISGG